MTSSFGAKYKVIQKIGEGSFSEVIKCEDKVSGTLYAAKRLKKTFKSVTDVMTCAEIIALHKLSRHPNVLYMIEYFYDSTTGKLVYVFELMDMSMYEFMKMKKRPVAEVKVKNYLYQMLKGLEHLHKNGLFHRDIKPENILVKLPQPTTAGIPVVQTEIVKLADLGSIRGIYSRPPYTEYISTRWYRSPECLLTVGYYGPKMDVWAAGCVFYEMLTLKPLFPGVNEIDQLSRIHTVLGTPSSRLLNKLKKKSHNCQNFPRQIGLGLNGLMTNFSDDGQNVLKLMIQYDPESRINVKRLVEHRYFAPLREQYLINQFRFTALQNAYGVESFSKCKGDHVANLQYITENLKQQKYHNVSTKVYDVHKAKQLSPMQTSKTSTDLNNNEASILWNGVSPRTHKTKPFIPYSKTLTDMNNVSHPPKRIGIGMSPPKKKDVKEVKEPTAQKRSNESKSPKKITSKTPKKSVEVKKNMLRDSQGPLVTHKQLREWGVSPTMLKPPKDGSTIKYTSIDPNTKKGQQKRHHHANHDVIPYSFRNTMTNLPNDFKKLGQHDSENSDSAKKFQSKSFVLPRRVTAKMKLDTIKESWLPNHRIDNIKLNK